MTAARALAALRRRLERPDPEEPKADPWSWVLQGDPLVGITPDEMALLTPEQQAHAVAVSLAAHGAAQARSRRNRRDPRGDEYLCSRGC